MLEVAEIECGHSITKMERCCTDQQVFERNPDTFSFFLTFDAPCQPRDIERYWMHGHILAQALYKR